MNTDQEQRVRAALRDLAEAVPVSPPPAATLRARAVSRPARTRRRWLVPALAATAVVVLMAAIAVLPGWRGPDAAPGPTTTSEPPILPERFGGSSWRTASAADSPPGPVIAAYAVADPGPPVLLLVGVDGRTYRQLDLGALFTLSHRRARDIDYPVLSPDGTRLAGDAGYVIDLTDPATSTWYPILNRDTEGSYGFGFFLAWSPESRRLAYQVRRGVALLDLATGQVDTLRIGSIDPLLAFAPDGQTFAVVTEDEDGAEGPVAIVDLAGNRLRDLGLPEGHRLAGGSAWSPDGALLVTADPDPTGDGFGFLDATGSGAPVPAPIWMPGEVTLLGWRSPRTMLVAQPADDSGPTRIMAVPVDGGQPWVVSQLPDNAQHRVQNLRLASGLLAEAELRNPGRPWHGPLPLGPRIALAALAATTLMLAVLVCVRWWPAATSRGWRRGWRRGSP